MIEFYTRNNGFNPVNNAKYLKTDTSVMKFPGGEVHIKGEFKVRDEVAVVRGSNGDMSDDLIALLEWADIRKTLRLPKIAVIPYLPAARQDRGLPFSAKVYANLINSANLDKVICIDPHSDVMPALLNNVEIINSHSLTDIVAVLQPYSAVIAPDSGASKRAYEVAKRMNVPMFQAWKHRDPATGALTGFGCETVRANRANGPALVVDDICDGGGTFMGLAESLKYDKEDIHLYITHGIFSGKHRDLENHFGRIITTNSHVGSGARSGDPNWRIIDIIPTLLYYALASR